MKTIITRRGRVANQEPLRDKLGTRTGTALEFSARNGMLVAGKAGGAGVSAVRGCLGCTVTGLTVPQSPRLRADEAIG